MLIMKLISSIMIIYCIFKVNAWLALAYSVATLTEVAAAYISYQIKKEQANKFMKSFKDMMNPKKPGDHLKVVKDKKDD